MLPIAPSVSKFVIDTIEFTAEYQSGENFSKQYKLQDYQKTSLPMCPKGWSIREDSNFYILEIWYGVNTRATGIIYGSTIEASSIINQLNVVLINNSKQPADILYYNIITKNEIEFKIKLQKEYFVLQ